MARPAQGGNYRALLTQGTFFKVGVQVSSISAVIPYIADQLGSPGVVVALLMPAFTAGTMLGTILGPKVLRLTWSTMSPPQLSLVMPRSRLRLLARWRKS